MCIVTNNWCSWHRFSLFAPASTVGDSSRAHTASMLRCTSARFSSTANTVIAHKTLVESCMLYALLELHTAAVSTSISAHAGTRPSVA